MTVAVIASGYDADNASIVVGSSNIIQLNLNNANVWTAQQTFTIGHLALKGASTGVVVLSTAISGSISYTITFPAQTSNDTVALIGTPSTWTATQTFGDNGVGSSGVTISLVSTNHTSQISFTGGNPDIISTVSTPTIAQAISNSDISIVFPSGTTGLRVGTSLFGGTAPFSVSPTGATVCYSIKITNGASNGYFLKSDAVGTASWSALPATTIINTDGTSWTGSGRVQLLPGKFNVTNNISIVQSNVALYGSGWNSVIYLPNSFNKDAIDVGDGTNTYRNILLGDFQIFGNGTNLPPGNNTSGYGVYWNANVERSHIDNLLVYTMGGTGIYLNQTSDNLIMNCYMENNGDVGLVATGGGTNHFMNNVTDSNQTHGYQLYDEGDDLFVGNECFGNTEYGLYLQGAQNTTVTGNTFRDDCWAANLSYSEIALDYDGSQYYAEYNTITGNTFHYTGNVSSNKPQYGIIEIASGDDYNVYTGNKFVGMGTGNYSLAGTHSYIILNARTTSFAPSNPTATASATGVMMGLGSTIKYTPIETGNVLIDLSGYGGTATGVVSATITPKYGTSTAPVNGASPTGTTWGAVGSIVVQSPTAGVDGTGWNVKKRITGLTVGTAYWFDIELATANASDSASVTNVTCVITEVG
jgi:parallel beta-helix repeat protein